MSVSKLTIVAQLTDDLTGPLKKVIDSLDQASKAAAKGAVSTERQADAFNRLAKEAGWARNQTGKWVNENNRYISRTERAALGAKALSLATHEAAQATRKQERAFRAANKAAGENLRTGASTRKSMSDTSKTTDQSTISLEAQAKAFKDVAAAALWTTNKSGRWLNASKKLASQSEMDAMNVNAMALATLRANEAMARHEAAFKAIVQAAGYKIAADGSVRNALGLYVKQQTVATMHAMAGVEATKMANEAARRSASYQKDQGNAAADLARHTVELNKVFDETVKALNYTYNAQGKLTTSTGRVISATQLNRMRAESSAEATYRMGVAAAEAAGQTQRAGEKVDYFSRNAVIAGNAVEQLARRFGASDSAARSMGVALGDSINNGAVANGFAWYKNNLDSLHEHAKSTADKIKSAMGTALKVTGGGALLGAGYAVKGGMERLNAMEQADVKLEVQDFNPEQRKAIKDEVDQLVRGTTLTLPQALDTAQGLLGSGVEYGPEFSEYMKTMVDAQSIYSAHDPKQLELVMRQIESKEILTGEERNQLAELGMPVNEWIAKEMGIEQSEVMDKIEAKEVTSDIWWKAMQHGVEGGAELMGKTFTGAWLNFLAAVKRSGQFFDAPLLEPMRRGLNMMTNVLDNNQEYFTKLGEAASVGMSEAVDTVHAVLNALKPLGPSIIRLVNAIAPVLPQLIQGFANWLGIIAPLVAAMINFAAILLEIVGPLLPGLIPLLFGVFAGLKLFGILKGIGEDYGKFFAFLQKGTWALTAQRIAILAAKFAMDLLAKSIMMFPGLWIVAAIILVVGLLGELYDKVGWVRDAMDWLSDGFRNADEWLNNLGASIDNFFEKNFPKLSKLNDALAAPLNWINDKLSGAGNAVGKETGVHEGLGTGEWAGSGQGMLRFTHGSGSLDENGDPIGRGAAENDRREQGIAPIEYATLFPEYANEAAPDETRNFFDPRNGGLPPLSWDVENNPEENPGGLADGGWTGPGSINVGERGREFVTSAWAANQVETNAPGAMQFINDTGHLPPTGGLTIHAPVNISGVNDPETIRAIVMAAIREASLEAERAYMNTPVRGAG